MLTKNKMSKFKSKDNVERRMKCRDTTTMFTKTYNHPGRNHKDDNY